MIGLTPSRAVSRTHRPRSNNLGGELPLSGLLADVSARPVTRAAAANALCRIGEAAAIEALVTSVKVKDDMIWRQVAIALGRIDRETVVPHLQRLCVDESLAVAEVAADAVKRWEGKLGRQVAAKTSKKSARKARLAKKKLPAAER